MKVLLIIDMQNGSFNPNSTMFDSAGVITRINALAAIFRKRNDQVIFIQHDGTHEGCFIPFTEAWELLPAMQVKATDLAITKTANDSFYNTTLLAELERLHIDELVITGTATDFCIDSTIKSAQVKDFTVTVIADGHTTENRDTLTAKQIIVHYNWVWSAMAPAKSAINVIDFDTYVREIDNEE